jgi:hypothetical protein
MKISRAERQHLVEHLVHDGLTLIFLEWKVFSMEQEVPDPDIWDLDGWTFRLNWHDFCFLR